MHPPLMPDQAARGHDIQHRPHNPVGDAAVACATLPGESAFILRPESMDYEIISTAGLALLLIGPLALGFAVTGGPGEGQNVEVEISGPALLSERINRVDRNGQRCRLPNERMSHDQRRMRQRPLYTSQRSKPATQNSTFAPRTSLARPRPSRYVANPMPSSMRYQISRCVPLDRSTVAPQ